MGISDLLVIMMFLTFLGLLMAGFQVAYCLWGSAVAFTLIAYISDLYFSTSIGLNFNFWGLAVKRIYGTMSNWTLVSVPMFIFMGLMLERSGTAERLLKSSQDLLGRIRGGLAIITTGIGVLLAASTGIVGASVVLLGTLSLPTMLKQGYSKELSTGTIASVGTLGIIIPPSIMLVVIADQLSVSVGDLFMGALLPGLALASLYIIYILLLAFLKPASAPLSLDRRPVSLQVLLSVVKDAMPPVVLIVGVLGSIFWGIATVTEASGIGALLTLLLTLQNKTFTLRMLTKVLTSTFGTIAFIFSIMIGATCFALVMRGLGGDELVEKAFAALPFGSFGIICLIMLGVFILGFFLDWIEITLILLPLMAPILSKLDIVVNGYGVIDNPKLVWFSVLLAVVLQTSFLTPPMGPALFYLQGICPPEIQLKHLYRGIVPFVILQIICAIIVLLFPSLVTWFPAVVYGR